MKKILLFTDLDGTLLDHDTYAWSAATTAIQRVDAAAIPLILNTSKTMAEVLPLKQELNNQHPFIIENGGAVCVPKDYFSHLGGNDDYFLQLFGKSYSGILETLTAIRNHNNFSFNGFSDMTDQELAQRTGLSLASAMLAKKRKSSEPLLWTDTEQNFEKFCMLLQEHALQVVGGGRFRHVMGMTDKGHAMSWLIDQFRQRDPGVSIITIALGDSPNDRPMLEQADHAVVIKPQQGDALNLDKINNVFYTEQKGPEGWQTAIHHILDQTGV